MKKDWRISFPIFSFCGKVLLKFNLVIDRTF